MKIWCSFSVSCLHYSQLNIFEHCTVMSILKTLHQDLGNDTGHLHSFWRFASKNIIHTVNQENSPHVKKKKMKIISIWSPYYFLTQFFYILKQICLVQPGDSELHWGTVYLEEIITSAVKTLVGMYNLIHTNKQVCTDMSQSIQQACATD